MAGKDRTEKNPSLRDQQIRTMESLTNGAIAWMMNVTLSAISNNQNIPRNDDGTFNAQHVLYYCTYQRMRRKDRPGDMDRIAREENSGEGSPLDEKRKLEVQKLELELLKMQRRLVPVEETAEFFGEMCQRLRKLGELLQRDYGTGPLLLLNETIGSMEHSLAMWKERVSEEKS